MVWSDGFPSADEVPDNRLASLLTTQKIAFRTAIEKHSFWTDSSLASAGVPRLSVGSFGPGSCRAYFSPVSSLSTHDSVLKPLVGRLYITSDTSHLYGFIPPIAAYGFLDNELPILLGSHNAIVWQADSQVTMQSNTEVVVNIGTTTQASSITTAAIAFPVAYAATAPAVQLQVLSSVTTSMAAVQATSITTGGFVLSLRTLFGTTSDFTVLWRSHGTAVL